MEERNGLSVSDALALEKNSGTNDAMGWGGNSCWWIIILILFIGWGGYGRGFGAGNNDGGGNGVNTVVVPTNAFGNSYNNCCTPATAQGVTDAFNFNTLNNGVRGIQNGICDGFYSTSLAISNLGNAMQGSINDVNVTNLQGFNATQNAIAQTGNAIQQGICQGFNGVQSAIAQTNYNMKDCCCETRESIMQSNFNNQTGFNNIQNQIASCCCDLNRGQENIKYALAQSTCDIMTNADKNTDRIINYLTQNELDSLRTEL